MKKFLPTTILAVLVVLPIITIFAFDARYNSLQSSMCAKYPNETSLKYACDDPEMQLRERVVTTAFYRHVADYFGREDGTSHSWMDSFAQSDYGEMVNDDARAEVKDKLYTFNREFAAALIVSIVIASVSGTLLVQKLIAYRRAKR